MPVATEAFEATYAGDLVVIGAGEWCAPGHDLVRRYPDVFAPDRRDKSPRVRQRLSSPPETARVRGRTRGYEQPRPELELTSGAYADLDEHCDFDGRESCGCLLGEPTRRGYLITVASGPGTSVRATSGVVHSFDYYQQIEDAHAHTGSRVVGHWHTHPSGDGNPSDTDKRSWQIARDDHYVDDDTYVHIIVCEGPQYLQLHGWAVTPDGLRSAPITLPERFW
jgi:integrative and conjugative element protein (TIGR02256 family)